MKNLELPLYTVIWIERNDRCCHSLLDLIWHSLLEIIITKKRKCVCCVLCKHRANDLSLKILFDDTRTSLYYFIHCGWNVGRKCYASSSQRALKAYCKSFWFSFSFFFCVCVLRPRVLILFYIWIDTQIQAQSFGCNQIYATMDTNAKNEQVK